MFAARTDWDTEANALAAALEARQRQGRPVLDLTESNPTRCGFSYDEQAILDALAQPASLAYRPDPKGLASARQAVAAYYEELGVAVNSENLILTSGTSEAYSFVLRLLAGPGDSILCPSPSYPLFDFLAGLNDVKLLRYSLLYDDGWRIDFDQLRRLVQPQSRALIVVSPNNPTGSYLRRDDLTVLVQLAREHELAIIADEVFRDYAWSDQPHRAESLVAVDGCLSFTLNGLSKISALPQMKLGWIAVNGPAELREDALRRLEVIADTYLSVGTPVQQAAGCLLEQRRKLQPQILERIRSHLALLDGHLSGHSPCGRLQAEGGWYAVLRLPATKGDQAWALELLEDEGIYVHPGSFFGFASGSHLVVSLITPPEVFCRGIDRLLSRVG